MDDLLECSVCLSEFDQPQLLPGCGHTFCLACVQAMRPQQCPLCRQPFDIQRVCPNFALQHLLEAGGAAAPPRGTSSSRPSLNHDVRKGAPAAIYERLGVPPAFAAELAQDDGNIALRIYLLDNSGSMNATDGSIFAPGAGGRLQLTPASRWEELQAMVVEQANWNRELAVPCQFQLLNSPSPRNPQEGVDIFHVDARTGNAQEQIRVLQDTLRRERPGCGTPLAARLGDIRQRLLHEGAELARTGRQISLVIATDGMPNEPRHEFVAALRRIMNELPIVVVIRLCTDDDRVTDFYDEVDKEVEMPLDIIDDLRGEAQQIYKLNPWLAYSPMLQTVRTAGTFSKVFDFVDERALTPMEVALCAQLLIRRPGMPPYSRHPDEFIREIESDLSHADQVFDAHRRRMVPPLDLGKLKAAVHPSKHGGVSGFVRGLGLGSVLDWFNEVPDEPVLVQQSHSHQNHHTQVETNLLQLQLAATSSVSVHELPQVSRPQMSVVANPPSADPTAVAGARMSYFSEGKQRWFECTILNVDAASGAVTIDLKPEHPLTAEQASRCLRGIHAVAVPAPILGQAALSAVESTSMPMNVGFPVVTTAVPGASASQIAVPGFAVGAKMEYWSERQRHWFPCAITQVDPVTHAVTIDLKPSDPLPTEQARTLLRPAGSVSSLRATLEPPGTALVISGPAYDERFQGMMPGAALEYYSVRQCAWFACSFVSVDTTTGAVEIDLKPCEPLTAGQARTCLRLPNEGTLGGSGIGSSTAINPTWMAATLAGPAFPTVMVAPPAVGTAVLVAA